MTDVMLVLPPHSILIFVQQADPLDALVAQHNEEGEDHRLY